MLLLSSGVFEHGMIEQLINSGVHPPSPLGRAKSINNNLSLARPMLIEHQP